MSTGADPKTLPVTREYEDGFDRTFGKRDPIRGRWIYLADGTSVRAEDYTPPSEEAVNAPIMAGRFYENTSTTTCDDNGKPLKVDIGSRQRHREFMRQRGLTTADDFDKPGGAWEKAAKERKQFFTDGGDRKERKEQIGRIAYELRSKNARRG